MNLLRKALPKDVWSVVRVFVILVILKIVINAVWVKAGETGQKYLPNLG